MYWYVRARHVASGRVIERLSIAGGASSESQAATDMREFLLKATGIDGWEVVEATCWPEGLRQPLRDRPAGAPQQQPRRSLLGWRYDPLLDP